MLKSGDLLTVSNVCQLREYHNVRPSISEAQRYLDEVNLANPALITLIIYFSFVFLSYLYLQPKKVKNISHDVFGTKTGRIHMHKQDLNKLQTRKVKALKRTADKTDDNNKTKRKKTKD